MAGHELYKAGKSDTGPFKMKKLIFRADGNRETGLGHLYRVFALIEIYRKLFDCLLLTRKGTAVSVIPDEYRYEVIPSSVEIEEEPAWLSKNFSAEEYFIITDGYRFDSAYQEKIRRARFNLMCIDDFAKGRMHANIIVNHAIGIKESDYDAEPSTRYALGPGYAILRPSFLNAAAESRIPPKSIKTVFVCFGGADSLDLTYKATMALLDFKAIATINVITGAAYASAAFEKLCLQEKSVQRHSNLSENELCSIMKESDFAVVSASNILYEVCAVKMPVLAGYYASNQQKLYSGCLGAGTIYSAGDIAGFSVKDFVKRLKEVLNLPGHEEVVGNQARMFDGDIRSRFLQLLSDIQYRRADENDLQLLYEWANDPVSRANSYFSDPISLEVHKKWFLDKLADQNAVIFIASVDGKPAGMVRYDVKAGSAVAGVMIDAKFRGKGLSVEFLKGTARQFFTMFDVPVLAYIKKTNKASLKAFESAGYREYKEETVHGAESWIYRLEKNV